PLPRLRAGRRAGGGAARAVHVAVRGPDHVHRRTGPARLRQLRPVDAADRDHGRLAVPGRGDEARGQRDAHGRGDHLLWDDRDLAVMDGAGYLNSAGRIKDMVIRGGENIYPREVEEFLYAHPAIEDVQVIGVPDAKFGEELCAWVKLRPGETLTLEDLRQYCTG